MDAVNRCVQVYILSVTSTAQTHYKTSHLTDKQIIEIIGLMGFQEFIQPLDQLNKGLTQTKDITIYFIHLFIVFRSEGTEIKDKKTQEIEAKHRKWR